MERDRVVRGRPRTHHAYEGQGGGVGAGGRGTVRVNVKEGWRDSPERVRW